MKSRTSFFNATVFKKNITRFAPVWALYSIYILMQMVAAASGETSVKFADNIFDALRNFAFVNFWYAPLCAILLFGDLYKSRMCNALHAMPIRRETLFFTNVISGLLFSLIPNTVCALLCLPFVGELFAVPFLWLLGVSLQHVFFFGTAVLAVYCAGNLFGMVLVYLIIQFFAVIFYGWTEMVYVPMMYGVQTNGYIAGILVPLLMMSLESPYGKIEITSTTGLAQLQLLEGWGYLAICAVAGVGFLVLALAIYRKRNLESAGDLLAVRKLRPVFLLLYTLGAGILFYAFADLFLFSGSQICLFFGLAVGIYTGQMLLDRTVRVFQKRTFMRLIAVIVVMVFSFAVVGFDILGIVRWVPKTSDIASVAISTEGYYTDMLPMTTAKEIEDVLMMHRHGIENRDALSDEEPEATLYIEYTLKNGIVARRRYRIALDTEAGQCLRRYESSPEVVLGEVYTMNIPVKSIEIPDAGNIIVDQQRIQQLMDAIIADCQDANLPQNWSFRQGKEIYEIVLDYRKDENTTRYRSIQFGPDAQHIVQWLEQNGISPEKWEGWDKEPIINGK